VPHWFARTGPAPVGTDYRRFGNYVRSTFHCYSRGLTASLLARAHGVGAGGPSSPEAETYNRRMAASRFNEPIEPMTLGNMCENGVRSLAASCRQSRGRSRSTARQHQFWFRAGGCNVFSWLKLFEQLPGLRWRECPSEEIIWDKRRKFRTDGMAFSEMGRAAELVQCGEQPRVGENAASMMTTSPPWNERHHIACQSLARAVLHNSTSV
jgi:hypothetical protein